MIVRCACLQGDVDPENRMAFDRFMASELRPLMKRFPGVISVRIMRAERIEDGGPPIYMTFESVYPSIEVME